MPLLSSLSASAPEGAHNKEGFCSLVEQTSAVGFHRASQVPAPPGLVSGWPFDLGVPREGHGVSLP